MHDIAAFRRGLGAEVFVEGQNTTIEYQSADGRVTLPELAAELVSRQVAVIFASGPPAALAAKRSTQSIPIIFVSGGDPVQMGLVSSFHQPAGNVTGFYFLLTGLVAKRLALLHELLPAGKRRAGLQESLEKRVLPLFAGRVLPFDLSCTQAYAALIAKARAAGLAIATTDAYIAAIAVANGLAVATRDTSPFEAAGATVINPWQA